MSSIVKKTGSVAKELGMATVGFVLTNLSKFHRYFSYFVPDELMLYTIFSRGEVKAIKKITELLESVATNIVGISKE
jgi:hypothetical protein